MNFTYREAVNFLEQNIESLLENKTDVMKFKILKALEVIIEDNGLYDLGYEAGWDDARNDWHRGED